MMYLRNLLIFVLMLFGASNAIAQTPVNPVRKAAKNTRFRVLKAPDFRPKAFPFSKRVQLALLEKNWQDAWKSLKVPKKIKLPKDGSAAYLWARIAFEANAYPEALHGFTSTQVQHSILAKQARAWAIKAAFRSNAFAKASALIATIPAKNLFWKEGGSFLFSRALLKNGKIDDGIRALDAGINLQSQGRTSPKDIFDIGNLLIKHKRNDAALRAWRYAQLSFPASLESQKITKNFNTQKKIFSESQQKYFLTRSEKERLKIGRNLFEKHHNKNAITMLNSLSESTHPKIRCEALYLIGKSFTKLRSHKKAIPFYKNNIKHCEKDTVFYRKSLYQLGRSQWNASQPKLAISTFLKLEKEFKEHSYADDAMLYRGRILREIGKTKEAENVFKAQLKKYPQGDMAPDAQWYLFHSKFIQGKYKQAIKLAKTFQPVGDEYSAGRLDYFVARAKELLGKKNRTTALNAYTKVIQAYPLSYYAFLAAQRRRELNKFSAMKSYNSPEDYIGKGFEKIKISSTIRNRTLFQKGELFASLLLFDEMQGAFKKLGQSISSKEKWALAKTLHYAKLYAISSDIARRRTGNWEKRYLGVTPDERWILSYPEAFKDEVEAFTKNSDVQSSVVYAIMREESGYNPKIRSWAGAFGLLQLMPATAKTIAKKRKIKLKNTKELLEAKKAIEIGVAYLDELGKKTNYHPAFMIAGYNGGWGNLSRWLKETKIEELDIFIEEIPYGQTRNYAKRVLRSYWIYQTLYNGIRLPILEMKINTQKKLAKK